ncbi:hypothetical protein SERLA73DRAFT_153027 [Serpula lacrymans var. lacrymans S7.3]|uniref:Uncharacterized protein n=1 Tax=Serpula lacrymans var. lacrymans (strain S7.3) TaxID=936435 RepID=F8PXD1_SERL3|nr:hypothetical protein SERLA73DRAFT_153027 [Serpula lacrymans var. lacrymans S7.3]
MPSLCFGCGKLFKTNKLLNLHTGQCAESQYVLGDILDHNTKRSRDEDEEREMLRKERKRLKRAEEFEGIISDSLVLNHHAVQEADQFAYQDDMLIFYHQPSLEEDKTLKPTICTPLLTHLNTKFHIPKVPNVLDLARMWMKFPQRILRQNQIHWPSSTPESGMSLDAICDAPNLKADMTEQAVLPQQRVSRLEPEALV